MNGLSTTEELVDRHANLASRGMANCRAAQALMREINRRRLEAQSAFLANDDDHYNPLENRDHGKWTSGPNVASSPKPNTSLPAKIKGTPLKFGFGLNEGLQNVASAMGQGVAQVMDPGPLPQNFNTFLRAQDQALATVPNPHIDPLTGELTGTDIFEQTMWRMNQEREIERERLRAPGESFSEAAAEEASEFGQLKDAAPGPKIAGTIGVKTGETLGYIAPAAIPFVGPVTGPIAAGLASTGDTFNQAYAGYKQAGYSDDEAREQARKAALNTGVATAIIFALPIGQLATLPKSALSRLLLTMGINGAQLSADQFQSLLQAKATYNPNLTVADIAKQTGNSFLLGAVLSGLSHGFETVNRGSPLPLSTAERQTLQADIQAQKPISMDTLERVNASGGTDIPKGYTPDVANNRLVYQGPDSATVQGEQTSVASGTTEKVPLTKGEITTYKDFKDRSVKGDNLEGHELWQHSNINEHDLATERLSTEASKQNPVIVVDKPTHDQVNAAQRSIDARSQTPTDNISANAKILPKLGITDNKVAAQFEQMAKEHSAKYIKPGTHEP